MRLLSSLRHTCAAQTLHRDPAGDLAAVIQVRHVGRPMQAVGPTVSKCALELPMVMLEAEKQLYRDTLPCIGPRTVTRCYHRRRALTSRPSNGALNHGSYMLEQHDYWTPNLQARKTTTEWL